MTIQINKGEVIAGVPIKKVRDFFRYVVAWNRDTFETSLLQERLKLGESFATALAQELMAQDYITQPQNGSYELTDKGSELVRASASGKIRRKTAETALAALLQRVEMYNADANKILTIDAVVVFGSFLGTKKELGDLDVAVKCRDRNNNGDRAKTTHAYVERSGRRFSNFVEFLAWPNTELRQILKARKRTIRIQDWQSFIRIVANDPSRVNYEVVFGNPEQVKAEISTARKRMLMPELRDERR